MSLPSVCRIRICRKVTQRVSAVPDQTRAEGDVHANKSQDGICLVDDTCVRQALGDEDTKDRHDNHFADRECRDGA